MSIQKSKKSIGLIVVSIMLVICCVQMRPAYAQTGLAKDLAIASNTSVMRARQEEVIDTYKEFTGVLTTGAVQGLRYDYTYKRLSFPNSYSYKGVEIINQYTVQGDKVNGTPGWGTISICKCKYTIW